MDQENWNRDLYRNYVGHIYYAVRLKKLNTAGTTQKYTFFSNNVVYNYNIL